MVDRTIPPRPVFHDHKPDSDQRHAQANNERLEYIMTLLEALIYSVEGFREDIQRFNNPPGSAGGYHR